VLEEIVTLCALSLVTALHAWYEMSKEIELFIES